METSIFEIIGPVMIGPSSSHTAGMARIGMMANRILQVEAASVRLTLSPKMRTTYYGHRSDAALFGGTLGMSENDPEIRDAIAIAHANGVETKVDFLEEGKYPENSARVTVYTKDGEEYSVFGTSIGGGSILISEIDWVPMRLTADTWHVIVWSETELAKETFAGAKEVQQGISEKQEYVTCGTFLEKPDESMLELLRGQNMVKKISLASPVLAYGSSKRHVEWISSCDSVCEYAEKENLTLAETAVRYESLRSGFSEKVIRDRMHEQWLLMKESVKKGQEEHQLLYGLTSGKDGKMLMQAVEKEETISGGTIPLATAMALGVMEYNGSMGCIVAAPTAGSSGIAPGCMTALQQVHQLSDKQIEDGLFVSALIGVIMAACDVSFSGSVGGCQGEVGVSSAITSAGMASIFTEDKEAIMHAMAICMKNLLGLVCDPIAAPIEVPCIKRNAVGVANAYISSDMALAGVRSFIPPDEVIDALIDVEKRLPSELKCATIGGLACTKTAVCTRKKLTQ